MRKLLLVCLSFLVITTLSSCDGKYKELYKITDHFVEELNSTYESYGLLGGMDYATTTPDGEFRVMPTGRLINVRIEHYTESDEYETLKSKLTKHYKDDSRVNTVYICNGGTVMIDCRN